MCEVFSQWALTVYYSLAQNKSCIILNSHNSWIFLHILISNVSILFEEYILVIIKLQISVLFLSKTKYWLLDFKL